jgi:hypothetical protein
MSNAILTPTIIAREALMQLNNNMVAANTVYRDYSDEYTAVGDTITVRRPVDFTVKDGAVMDIQDVEEGSLTVAMDKQKHVAWKFSSKDLTLSIEEYSARYIRPAMIQLANQVDRDLLSLYKFVNNWAGTAGQTINSYADFAKGPERLDVLAVPEGERFAVMSPADYWGLTGSQTALAASDRLVESAYERAILGNVAGVTLYKAQNVQTHTGGTRDNTTPLVKGAGQVSTYANVKTTMTQNLICDGFDATATIAAGDVFTLDGVYDVNPVTKATLPHLKQFTVITGGTCVGGEITLVIYPAIITSGAYQNVSAAPDNDAALTFVGAASTGYPQNMVYHKNAFALVTRALIRPDGAAFSATESADGMSVRIIKDYDMVNDQERIRLDILYGVKAIDPRLATRLSGTS